MMIPARVALALQADGWWLRSEIVWHKPNPMPESVTDRPTKSHEMIYLLAKSARYFYDAEAIREVAKWQDEEELKVNPQARQKAKLIKAGKIVNQKTVGGYHYAGERNGKGRNSIGIGEQTLSMKSSGRNKRDVWVVTTKPYKEAHFATFPPDLIEPCILAGTSERGECPECGKAWVRVVEKVREHGLSDDAFPKSDGASSTARLHRRLKAARDAGEPHDNALGGSTTTGWLPQCECGLEPVPQTVLDPFNGSGTTGEVSIKHKREYVGCELNPEYIELTHKRLANVDVLLF